MVHALLWQYQALPAGIQARVANFDGWCPFSFIPRGEAAKSQMTAHRQLLAFVRCSDPGPGYRLPALVTASVDAIQLNHRLNLDSDLSMSGQVRHFITQLPAQHDWWPAKAEQP